MDKAQTEEKLAVECGYWNNFRYNPAAEKKFTLDSKAPKMETYQDFLKGEVRYLSLTMKNPERAKELFARNEQEMCIRDRLWICGCSFFRGAIILPDTCI